MWQSEYMAGAGQQVAFKPKYMTADMRHFQVHAAPGRAQEADGRTFVPGNPLTARTAALHQSARPRSTQQTRERAAILAKREGKRGGHSSRLGKKENRAGLFDVGRGVGLPDFATEYAESVGASNAAKATYISADRDDRRCHGPKPEIALFTDRRPPPLGQSILQG